MIKLVRGGEDLKMLALVMIARFPFATEANEGVTVFFPLFPILYSKKPPNKQIKREL